MNLSLQTLKGLKTKHQVPEKFMVIRLSISHGVLAAQKLLACQYCVTLERLDTEILEMMLIPSQRSIEHQR